MNPKPTPHLFLIDGYNFVFRAFYAIPPLSRRDGFPTNAISGFCNMLIKLLGNLGQRNAGSGGDDANRLIAIALDTGKPTFRHNIYSLYKANRTAPPEALVLQFPVIRAAVEAFGIPVLEEEGFEADDLIATYAQKASRSGMHVTVVSSDKDLLQLLENENVDILDVVKFVTHTAPYVVEKYGIPPHQLADLFALIGDSSDNVPGVPSIGPKTAATLIQTYGSLENIFEQIESVPKKLKQENLIAYKDQAFLSGELIKLHLDAPMRLPLDELKPKPLTPPSPALLSFLEEMELHQLSKRLLALKPAEQSKQEHTLIEGTKQLQSLQAHIGEEKMFTFSLPDPNKDIITVNAEYNVPINKATLPFLKSIFETEGILAIGHNVKESLKKLRQKGVEIHTFDDVMLMAYSLECGILDNYQLERLHAHYQTQSLLDLWETLRQKMVGKESVYVYQLLERPMVKILASMEEEGIQVDKPYLEALSESFEKKIEDLAQAIMKEAGVEFNLASPKQLGEILFQKMGYAPEGKTRKTGHYRTDSETLETMAAQGISIASQLLAWRMLSKLKNTYTDPLVKSIHPQTGRIHPTFLLASTNTGRLACQSPNLQNIPIRTPEGRQVREAFIAKKDHLLLGVDYNQIELRILAYIAGVPALKEAFQNQEDIHTLTASEVFGVAKSSVDPSLRRKAKAVNFGIIYGLSAFGLARQLSIDGQEAKAIIDRYFERFPEIKTYMQQTVENMHSCGYVTTLLNRKIHFPPTAFRDNPNEKRAAERAAINAPIQGSAADIIRLAMLRFSQEARHIPARMLLQIHDELIFEVPESQLESAQQAIVSLIEQAHTPFIPMDVPLKVEAQASLRWGMPSQAISA